MFIQCWTMLILRIPIASCPGPRVTLPIPFSKLRSPFQGWRGATGECCHYFLFLSPALSACLLFFFIIFNFSTYFFFSLVNNSNSPFPVRPAGLPCLSFFDPLWQSS